MPRHLGQQVQVTKIVCHYIEVLRFPFFHIRSIRHERQRTRRPCVWSASVHFSFCVSVQKVSELARPCRGPRLGCSVAKQEETKSTADSRWDDSKEIVCLLGTGPSLSGGHRRAGEQARAARWLEAEGVGGGGRGGGHPARAAQVSVVELPQ